MTSGYGLLGVAVCAAIASGVAAQSRAPALSTDELIARHEAARGGLPALRAIHTVTMSGTMRPGGFDAQLHFSETIARPGSVRMEATLQGLTLVQAYDGTSGWQIQPFQGRKDPEAVSADDAKSLEEEADFEGGLIDYRAKGSTVDNLGVTDIDGAPAYALRVSLKNGDQETYYIDPDAMLTIRVVTRQRLRGAEVFSQTDYGDYEKVDGVYFPFEVAAGPKDSTVQQRITYDKIVANAPVDPAYFARPAGPVTATVVPPASPVKAPHAPLPANPDRRPVVPPPAR